MRAKDFCACSWLGSSERHYCLVNRPQLSRCTGELHLYDNRYFYFEQDIGQCVSALARDAAVQALTQLYQAPCGGDRRSWLSQCAVAKDSTEKGRLAEVLALDSIVVNGLPLDGQVLGPPSVFFFKPGTPVVLPRPGETAVYVPSDRFWPYVDAVVCSPDLLSGVPTHKGQKSSAAPDSAYTHVAIQVTLEEPKGRKRAQTLRFFSEANMAAWSYPDSEARWCLLWITPYRREAQFVTHEAHVFDERFLRFGEVSAELSFLDLHKQ